MRKSFLLLLFSAALLLTVSHQSKAQSAFEKGNVIGNAGFIFYNGAKPITVSGEYGVTDVIGVGAKLWYSSTAGFSTFAVSAVGNYHLAPAINLATDQFDPYAGITVGKPFVSGNGVSASGSVYVDAQAGARYYFTDQLGAMAQLNIGISKSAGTAIEIGVTYKFGSK